MSMQCLLERTHQTPGARVTCTCGSCSSRSGGRGAAARRLPARRGAGRRRHVGAPAGTRHPSARIAPPVLDLTSPSAACPQGAVETPERSPLTRRSSRSSTHRTRRGPDRPPPVRAGGSGHHRGAARRRLRAGSTVGVENTHPDEARTKDDAIRPSRSAPTCCSRRRPGFVSLLDPPPRPGRRGRLPPGPVLAGAGRAPGGDPTWCWARRSSSRLPRDRRGERRRPVRLHRDRRDPDPAGDDDDRRREGGGPRHRPTRRGDHRPLRRHVRRRRCSSCTASLRDPHGPARGAADLRHR